MHVPLALREIDCDRNVAILRPTERPGFARTSGTEKAAQVGGLACFGLRWAYSAARRSRVTWA